MTPALCSCSQPLGHPSASRGQPSTVRQWERERAGVPWSSPPTGATVAAAPLPGPSLSPGVGPTPDPSQVPPPKSPPVTCASTEAGSGAPGLVRVSAAKRVVLSGRAAASVGSLGSGAKAVGSRRTQAQRTRAAMATPTQDALRRALGFSIPLRSAQATHRAAAVGSGWQWWPLAAPGCTAPSGRAALQSRSRGE